MKRLFLGAMCLALVASTSPVMSKDSYIHYYSDMIIRDGKIIAASHSVLNGHELLVKFNREVFVCSADKSESHCTLPTKSLIKINLGTGEVKNPKKQKFRKFNLKYHLLKKEKK